MERNRKTVRTGRRKVSKWAITTAVIIIVLAILAYYAYEKISTVKNLDVTVTEIAAKDFSLTRFTLAITLEIHNPNKLEAEIGRFHAWVFANNVQVADFKLPEKITIPKGDTITRTVEFTINYLDLGASIVNAIRAKELTWIIQGEYDVQLPFGIPYEYTFRKEHTWSPNSQQ